MNLILFVELEYLEMSFDSKKLTIPVNSVIDGINNIFSRIMDLRLGGADYNCGHAMISGNKTFLDNGVNAFERSTPLSTSSL